MKPSSCFRSTAAEKVAGLLTSEVARRYIRGRRENWRKAEGTNPMPLPAPSRFERAPGTRPVDFP
jgi:hypothetical protein